MNEKNKEYDEFLNVLNKSNENRPTQSQSVPQARTTTRLGRYLSPKRMSAKKRKARQRKIAVVSALALVVLVLVIVLICKSCAGGSNDNADLSGVWQYDQYTEYEFDGEGKGCMCLDGNNHFEFTYIAEDGTLHLDFVLDYVTDCQYTYTVDGDILMLIGGEGTAEVGKVYELKNPRSNLF